VAVCGSRFVMVDIEHYANDEDSLKGFLIPQDWSIVVA
jgi:hypothetical protein